MAIPITPGSGAASVAAETVAGLSYQRIEVLGQGGSSVLAINPDGSLNASIIGSPSFTLLGNASVSGTVGASVIGHAPVFIVGGSIAGTFTTANQSVSGTVDVGNFPTSQNVNGSVVAFQGTSPFVITGSIQGAFAGGTSSVIQQGRWVTSILSSTPSSVLVGASIFGTAPVTQATTPWVVNFQNSSVISYQLAGSVLATSATITPAANQSVSGTVQTDVRGSVATVIIGGSIAASFTPPANQSVSGAVSVSNFPTTQNVSGSVVASGTVDIGNTVTVAQATAANLKAAVSVIGTVPVTQTTSPWIITGSVQGSFSAGNSSVQVLNFPTTQNVSGSVVAFQNATPWIITGSVQGATSPANQSVSGAVTANQGTTPWVTNFQNSSIVAYQLAGSVLATSATVNPAANQSVSGTVGASVIGWAPVQWANSSIITVAQGSVATVIIGGSIAASFTPPANQSISGTVNIGTGGPVSVTGTMSVLGTVPVTIVSGSIATIPGNSSVQVLNFPANQSVSGAVSVSNFPTNQSISGTIGASILGNVNTTITSVAAAEGFIRIVPPIGATVQGIADLQVVQGASVTAIAAQGTSIFTYITGVQVTNFGSASVLVKLGGGLGSTLGWTIAPAGGGSNVVYPTGLKTGANSAFTASINGTASVIVSAQGFTALT